MIIVNKRARGSLTALYLRPTDKLLRSTTGLTRTNRNRNLLTSTVENLKKGRHTSTHANVEISLGALDVIVEVVTESKNNITSVIALARLIVTSLKKERSIAVSVKAADASKLRRRILQVGVAGRSTRHVLAELIQENMAKDDIIRIIKEDGEDDNNTITILLEPDRLLRTVVDLNNLATRSTLAGLFHHLVKNRGKKVAGHTRSKTSNLGSVSLRMSLANANSNGDIILGLRTSQKAAVDLLEVFLTTVGLNLIPALAGDGNEQLALNSRQMPDNLVEICDCDIDLLSLLSDKLGVDDIVDDAIVRLQRQRGCHFLCVW